VEHATRLGRRPKAGIGAVKRAVRFGGSLPLEDGLRLEAGEFLAAITTRTRSKPSARTSTALSLKPPMRRMTQSLDRLILFQ